MPGSSGPLKTFPILASAKIERFRREGPPEGGTTNPEGGSTDAERPPEGGTTNAEAGTTKGRVAALCLGVFLAALGVRALHWQDSHVETVASKTSLMGVFERYKKEARRMLEDGRILFPEQPPERGDARMLVHPPGYSMLLAAIYRVADHAFGILWIVQIVCDSAAAVLVFLIALETPLGVPLRAHASSSARRVLGAHASSVLRRIATPEALMPSRLWIAFIAGMLTALSPQLAHYSLVFSPDSLAVLPILLSIYLIVLAMKKPKLIYLALSGALIGVSCWIRANALALAPFLALLMIPLLFDKGCRLRNSLTFVVGALIVVAPITLRNYIVFHRFIPISIAAGLNLAEGIGNFDPEGKLGMPRSDREARFKDAEWAGRPDYAPSLWIPDGIERDQMRTSRALGVIRERPFWFLGVMFRRAAFMLRYNDSHSYGWPADTSVVSRISAEPPFSHGAMLYSEENIEVDRSRSVLVVNGNLMDTPIPPASLGQPVWSSSAADLLANGERRSTNAALTIDGAGHVLTIAGDDSQWGDQFASAAIPVERSTDYILLVELTGAAGPTTLKITDRSGKSTLATANTSDVVNTAFAARPTEQASTVPPSQQAFRVPAPAGSIPSGGLDSSATADEKGVLSSPASSGIELQMPFASGRNSEIRVVASNNGVGARPATLSLDGVRLLVVGPTAGTWTRYPRFLVRGLQGILFNTWRMGALILAGAFILALSRQWRTLVVVLAVPLYYLAAQSVLSTEYRYILAIHYFVFILAAVTLCAAAAWCYRAALRLSRRIQASEAPAST
jgi:hypothetical protein